MKKLLLSILFVCAAFGAVAGAWQDEGRASVYYRDGARFALEGRLAEAARAFEQAVALDPSNGNAYYALGNVYAESGRWAEAVNAYYKAVSLNKEDVEAYNNLGVALRMRGQNVQAAAAFERAVKIYPKWAEPYYHLAEARRALGQQSEAREAYERALRLRPDYATRPPQPFIRASVNATATPAPGRILKAMNAVNLGAIADEKPTATSARTSATPDGSRATTSRAAPAPADAKTPPASTHADATRAGADSTSTTLSPYELGQREARAGRYQEAVAAFRQAILLERSNAAAYRALGDAYAALGEWRESVDAYEQAARLAPDDAETYQKLGRSYARLRETSAQAETADGAAASGVKGATGSDTTNVGERRAASNAQAHDDPDPTAVYRVGPGDVLDVRVLDGREHRTTSYEVTPTGLLDYPRLAEPLAVAGLTTEEVAARLGAALRLRAAGESPEIVVGVREYASHAVIVGGMVKDPGTKILQREGVPLYVIVAHAQPLPGAGQALLFARATGLTTAVDLSDTAAMNALVRPGDVVTLRALPRQFVYVAGAVGQPGQKEFHAGLTLTQALLAAGGTQAPTADVVTITRQGADGRLSTNRYRLAEIKAGRVPDPTLRPGDRVEVLR
jgi:protein involved in polysaccharide export with SLBB domain/Flp pilus assembly protein TadD